MTLIALGCLTRCSMPDLFAAIPPLNPAKEMMAAGAVLLRAQKAAGVK